MCLMGLVLFGFPHAELSVDMPQVTLCPTEPQRGEMRGMAWMLLKVRTVW